MVVTVSFSGFSRLKVLWKYFYKNQISENETVSSESCRCFRLVPAEPAKEAQTDQNHLEGVKMAEPVASKCKKRKRKVKKKKKEKSKQASRNGWCKHRASIFLLWKIWNNKHNKAPCVPLLKIMDLLEGTWSFFYFFFISGHSYDYSLHSHWHKRCIISALLWFFEILSDLQFFYLRCFHSHHLHRGQTASLNLKRM